VVCVPPRNRSDFVGLLFYYRFKRGKTLTSCLQEYLQRELRHIKAALDGRSGNTLLKAVEVERKVKETEELEERTEQLERSQEQRGGKRWGA
jgi:hypothetical protein